MEKDACITLYIFLSFFLLPLIPNFFSHIDWTGAGSTNNCGPYTHNRWFLYTM
jgi:hypothetical protein